MAAAKKGLIGAKGGLVLFRLASSYVSVRAACPAQAPNAAHVAVALLALMYKDVPDGWPRCARESINPSYRLYAPLPLLPPPHLTFPPQRPNTTSVALA
jgi:hypothetical protein